MSGSDAKWGELSSQHERFVEQGEATRPRSGTTGSRSGSTGDTARSQWAELASQRERLLDQSDPLYRLASSSHSKPGMRLVSTAA
jgi:hypothetical protein